MREELSKRISKNALTVWRIYGIISGVIVLLLAIGVSIATFIFNWPIWIILLAFGLFVIDVIYSVILRPNLKWKRWKYEVRDQEIELQYGLFTIKRTLIPMIRVQHVDMKQGPILKKYKLASISISTAGGFHEIPALDENEAEELRYLISSLARVADEDV